MKKFVTYLRVSTQKQGRSGLGLDAQRKMCEDFIKNAGGKCVQEFVDVESGTHRDRKGLAQAICYCKQNEYPLVIAKLDRLARDVEFCFRVVNTGIEIHFTDMPVMNSLLLGVFASVAQYERELTSDRTKKALAVKKAQGCKLGAASEKYKETANKKEKEEKEKEAMERGETKRQRHQTSRDVQVFLRILRQVFPDETKQKSVERWNWERIRTRCGRKEMILAKMQDYQELDEDGKLFHGWDFSLGADNRALSNKLCAYIQSIRKSFTSNK